MFGHDNEENQQGDNGMGGGLPEPIIQPSEEDRPSGEAVEIAPSTPSVNDNTSSDTNSSSTDSSAPSAVAAPSPSTATDTNDLLDIKQNALQALTPLLGHLEQTPEERFRTTMMMIQAADNQDLISTAYEAAQKISDEKVRAQALLDIVNEINYFTQKNA